MDERMRALERAAAGGDTQAEIQLLRQRARSGDTDAKHKSGLLDAGLPLHLTPARLRFLAYVGEPRARQAVEHWQDSSGWSMDWGLRKPGYACYPDVYRINEPSQASTSWLEGLRHFARFPSERGEVCDHGAALEQHLVDCDPCSQGAAMFEGCAEGERLFDVAYTGGQCARCNGAGRVLVMTPCPNIGSSKHGREDYWCGACEGKDEVPESMEPWLLMHVALAAARLAPMSGHVRVPNWVLDVGDDYAWSPTEERLTRWSQAMVHALPVPAWLIGPGHVVSADVDRVIQNAASEFGEDLVKAVACARVTEMVLESNWPREKV